MPKVSKSVKRKDKLIIYFVTARKVIRGLLKSPFLGSSKFPLFVGKHVDITHKRNIYCGKNVKFEAYSEIHGLSKKWPTFWE